MAQLKRTLTRFLGMNCQGDLGPYTTYTSARGKLVIYPRAPPLRPPSPAQQFQRDRFSDAARAWGLLQATTRAAWNRAAARSRLRMSGYALWTFYQQSGNVGVLKTIEAQSGESLL